MKNLKPRELICRRLPALQDNRAEIEKSEAQKELCPRASLAIVGNCLLPCHLDVVISQQLFERPYFTAQGTPPERVAALRTAFDAAMRDPQLLAEAEKASLDIAPLPGAEVEAVVQKLFATPKPIIDRAKEAIRP